MTDNPTPAQIAADEEREARMFARHATEGCDDPCLVPDEAHNDTEAARLQRAISRAIAAARWAQAESAWRAAEATGDISDLIDPLGKERDRLRAAYEEASK